MHAAVAPTLRTPDHAGRRCLGDDRLVQSSFSSLLGNTELNAAFRDPAVVRALRELLAEHLGEDTAGLDDRAALGLYRRIARANRARRDAGDAVWQGLAFTDPPYGQ
jgi:hypothetical protein